MKNIKLYNVIFPIWFLLFFPPVILVTLIGNFIIDSLVLAGCYAVFRLKSSQGSLIKFYKMSILKVWIFGFVADIAGAVLLFVITFFDLTSYEISSAISYNAFRHPIAFLIVILAMLLSCALIFLFNYKFVFKNIIEDKTLRLKVAISIAITTIPWTFILPIDLFGSGY